jgi:O-antigen/teichoic acid export membrane protein
MAILLSYWLINGATGVGAAMLVARGRAKELTKVAWLTALLNLGLSVALTPWLGLDGVAIGTAIPYLVVFPIVMRLIVRDFPVGWRRLVRHAILPAYATATVAAVAVGAVRLLAPPDDLVTVALTAGGGIALAFAFYVAVCLSAAERLMLRSIVRRAPAAG